MRLAQQGTPGLDPSAGSIIHFYHFRRWRESGIAYELRDCKYNEVNRTLLSTAYGTRKEYKDRCVSFPPLAFPSSSLQPLFPAQRCVRHLQRRRGQVCLLSPLTPLALPLHCSPYSVHLPHHPSPPLAPTTNPYTLLNTVHAACKEYKDRSASLPPSSHCSCAAPPSVSILTMLTSSCTLLRLHL